MVPRNLKVRFVSFTVDNDISTANILNHNYGKLELKEEHIDVLEAFLRRMKKDFYGDAADLI